MKKTLLAAFALVALSFIIGIYLYPGLPGRMITHWGASGQANGFMAKPVAVFLLPAISLVLVIFLAYLPNLDPLKKNYADFRPEYDGMVAMLSAFLSYVYTLTLLSNLGYNINMVQFLSPAFAALFLYLGYLLSKAKRNWFVGIRTPWTLSSDAVWEKTHRIGSKLFMAAGIVALIGLVLPRIGLLASIAVLIASAIFLFVYSYIEYGKEQGKGGRKRKAR